VSLSEELNSLAAPGPTPDYPVTKSSAPTGWEPGVKYDPTGAMTVTVPPTPTLADEDSWRAAVESLGVTVPEGWRIRLVEARYDPAAWHRDAQGEDAYTAPVWRYKFAVEPAPRSINTDELLAWVGKRKNRKQPTGQPGATYTVAAGDLQIGKPDGDGTLGTVERFVRYHENSLDRYKHLRKRGLAGDDVALLWVGDCIEGTESQGSKLLARLELTVTEQVRIYRRLMLMQVKDYLDAGARVRVAVVPGNHDEAKRVGDQMATVYSDSWAIEGAAAVADALDVSGYGDQVAFVFPGRDELTVTLDIDGTVVGVLHGHQTRGKMQTWLAGQSLGRQAVGHSTDLIVSGHYHHLRIEQIGPVTHIQVPSMDGGSAWWRHKTGLDAPPGMVTLLVAGGGWHGLEVL
jgi:predicted phosphodiesterase